ncbi:hypothetical protein B0H63DRAFT_518592 [Podospora didyma]|uniref:Uncharacterized protein n=1 Tax=Podospora didyma TaxID=330526 RepID=A0AAE0NXH1_9PEZI|nr:hypothetical protein B0H63DRAFT_518592 [Podospora didyma]
MVQKYNIFGAQVASKWLAMATLGTMFGGVYFATGSSKQAPAAPPLNAASSDEADFIKKFIDSAESDEKAKAAPAKH